MTYRLTHADFWRNRLKASGIHLAISTVIAALAALLVFGIWYPYPYREISGGRELFLLVVSVDVILGPLITLAVFDRSKPKPALHRDLAFVGVIQLAALVYGLWTVAVARPVHLVFELDRFRVIHAIDVAPETLGLAPPDIVALPWTGPSPLSLRPFKDNAEKIEATVAALQGMHLGSRPELWQSYAAGVPQLLQVAKPVAVLKSRFPDQTQAIDQAIGKVDSASQKLLFVPLVGRKSFWTAFVDPKTGQMVAAMPLDSF